MKMNRLKLILLLYATFLAANFSFSQVGINTTNPLSTLDINGTLSVKVVTLTGNGAGNSGNGVAISDGVYVSVNPITQDDKFQLPNPTLFPGRTYIIRNINNSITAQITSAANLIFPKHTTTGSASVYLYEGNTRSLIFISDGHNWTYF
jgi:hypothetical protein